MLSYMGPSSSEYNINSEIMVEADEAGSESGTVSQTSLENTRQTDIQGEIAAFEAAMDDQSTVRLSQSSDASDFGEGGASTERRQMAGLGKAPMREESSDQSVSTAGYQGDMSTTLGRFTASATSSRRNTTSSRSDRRPSYQSSSSRRPSVRSTSSRHTSTSQRVDEEGGVPIGVAISTDLSSDDETPRVSRSSSRPTQHYTSEPEAVRTEVIVPRWQPDAEVTKCPICHTAFGWLNRKHHCRKCGRVVCNSCSPHRITIPYQYIVQPPDHPSPYSSITYNRLLDPQAEGRINNSLEFGGGDRVRLCNPCVPDPNVAPPQTNQTGHVEEPRHALGYHGRSQSSIITSTGIGSLPSEARFRLAEHHRSRTTREPTTSRRAPAAGLGTHPRTAEEFQNWYRERAAANNGQGVRSRSSTVCNPILFVRHMLIRYKVAVTGRDVTEDMRSFLQNVRGPSPSWQSASNARTSAPSQRYAMSGEDLRSRPLPRTPQIREEDECPICHRELPSSSLPNAETLRSDHIISCIDRATNRLNLGSNSTNTATTPPASHPPLTITQSSSQSSSSPVSATSTPLNPPSATNTPLPAHVQIAPPEPLRRTGVFPYIATEKDCQDDAECQICLEEYEPGVHMGRLECFCKFHLSCIRKWFEKHPGRCPMHQHDEYGY
ncbi:hypothetical protein ACMFMG_000904 [Clarireedia jacksonii]